MALKYSTGLRNFLVGEGSLRKAFEDAVLNIYSGAAPATADDAPLGVLLAKITKASGASRRGRGPHRSGIRSSSALTRTGQTFHFALTVDGVGPVTFTYHKHPGRGRCGRRGQGHCPDAERHSAASGDRGRGQREPLCPIGDRRPRFHPGGRRRRDRHDHEHHPGRGGLQRELAPLRAARSGRPAPRTPTSGPAWAWRTGSRDTSGWSLPRTAGFSPPRISGSRGRSPLPGPIST